MMYFVVQSELEDAQEKYRSIKVTLDNAYRSLLRLFNVTFYSPFIGCVFCLLVNSVGSQILGGFHTNYCQNY